ncbi:MAG: sulfonate ABC transporter substrate-binding protein [Oscillatoriales cyanobacterium C42_A2020_001]|nr:sulfonate ABC transporter substrate-binding protein [Leptolyngbyaceae cyanobacterium C42_A2020_001]
MFPQFQLEQLQLAWHRFKRHPSQVLSLLFALGLSLSLITTSCSSNSPTNTAASPSAAPAASSAVTSTTVVRVGYQKAASVLSLLKSKELLEKAFAASGVKVSWAEFPAGQPLLEALNAGSIDFGYTGEAPPIFAQSTGVPVRYVAYDPWGPKGEAIVVPKDSPIKSLTDLKGKKVGVAKGSNTQYLLVSALQSVGLKFEDVEVKFLKPAEARAAFEGRNIDAWSIWDPYLAVAEEQANARILTDATGLAPNRGYYLASQSFVDKSPEALKVVLDEVRKESDWAKSNPTEVAKFLAPSLGIDAAILEKAEKRREYGVLPLTPEVITNQQKIADTFQTIKLIPKAIKIEDAVWQGVS